MIKDTVIRQFDATRDEPSVIALWRAVFGYGVPYNAPQFVIRRKLKVDDRLFSVAEHRGVVIGTVMAGYDGHRGWIYSLAVQPEGRGRGVETPLIPADYERQSFALVSAPRPP